MDKEKKVSRILILYDKLRKGEVVDKYILASDFGVHARSIQRDIDDIRGYLAEWHSGEHITYDHSKSGYLKSDTTESNLTTVEIIAITKIILESRAFQKDEMKGLINAIVNQAEEAERKAIQGAINNELHHYKPLFHSKPLLKILWDISTCIKEQQQIEVIYERMDGTQSLRWVKPMALIFSEFYFYLVAYIKDSKYQYPAYFRIDRIKYFKMINERFSIRERERVEAGEIRNRSQFMYAGELIHLKFIFYGSSLAAVLDRLPNAQVLENLDRGWLIEAKVYGKGCMMWLLSQGSNVEVIEPKSLREEIKAAIQSMMRRYAE
ncbi:hypothetical protein ASD24_01540 [Paenibacillus sp. Root52]|uniref:helix-turn-helix transcriptional regulator n=1 Tax=Paenibacillus sp. Root52 TaxID=1736552 RepID=UPI0006F39F40|nr:WYL domain-containing protein [Paenibacillus sp. Root52]KQY94272.1 hypothetical protein ASD24_01540 [Paenibacillus sp. Root52]